MFISKKKYEAALKNAYDEGWNKCVECTDELETLDCDTIASITYRDALFRLLKKETYKIFIVTPTAGEIPMPAQYNRYQDAKAVATKLHLDDLDVTYRIAQEPYDGNVSDSEEI